MRKNLFVSIVVIMSMGCSGGSGVAPAVTPAVKVDTAQVAFLKYCDHWDERGLGRLMGLESRSKDSTSKLAFTAYYSCAEPFEVIYLYKGGIEKRKEISDDSLGYYFLHGCTDYYNEFDCFAFVLKMRDPQKQADLHATHYTFPTRVRAYRRLLEDKWALVADRTVDTYEDYRVLQFNSMYGLH